MYQVQRQLRSTAWFLVFIGTSALAQPLLGTGQSFEKTLFCQKYACKRTSSDPLGKGLVEERFTVRGQFSGTGPAGGPPLPPTVISTVRQNGKLLSIGFTEGVQDYYFSGQNDYAAAQMAMLVETATGTRPTARDLHTVNKSCEQRAEKVFTLAWPPASPKYTIACSLTSREFTGAWRFNFRVF